MRWMRERDALIAQTLAFVQSVTGRRDAGEPPPPLEPADAKAPAVPAADIVPIPAVPTPSAATAAPPRVVAAAPRPIVPDDLKSELTARIASFRAHQERFNREREAYFSATLEKLRASIKDAAPPPPPEK